MTADILLGQLETTVRRSGRVYQAMLTAALAGLGFFALFSAPVISSATGVLLVHVAVMAWLLVRRVDREGQQPTEGAWR